MQQHDAPHSDTLKPVCHSSSSGRSSSWMFLLFLLTCLNTGICGWLLYQHYVPQVVDNMKTVREVVHTSLVQYQWLKKTSDPLDAWRVSSLYFEAGRVQEARDILCQAYAQLSIFSDTAWLWAEVLPRQIERLGNIMQDTKNQDRHTSWWSYMGVTVRSIATKQNQITDNYGKYSSDALTTIRRQYSLTQAVYGEVQCGR